MAFIRNFNVPVSKYLDRSALYFVMSVFFILFEMEANLCKEKVNSEWYQVVQYQESSINQENV